MTESAEMPFLDHLEELRWRIIWSLAALVIGVMLGFAFVFIYEERVATFLQGPILPFLHGHKLVYTHPGDGFSILLQLALYFGVLFALPMILYQVWIFLSPALHRSEKRIALPVIFGIVFLFCCGAAMAWWLVLPMTLKFFFALGDRAFDQMITVSEYFSMVSSTVLAMGLVFELPIVILILSAFGLVTPRFLMKYRRHAAAGSYIVAAIITPGDMFFATLIITFPLYFLYELSIGLSYLVYRSRQKKLLLEQAEGAPEAIA